MPQPAAPWTADLVRNLPDDGYRYELVSGELVVTPAPRGGHQVAVFQLAKLLDQALSGTGVGHVLHSPADISLGEDEVLQPDLFVYRTATGDMLRDWTDITALLLVIEVLSPSTALYDRQIKRHRYQRAGIPEYWIVDLDARVIERWRPGDERAELVKSELVWNPGGLATPLRLDLPAWFASIGLP